MFHNSVFHFAGVNIHVVKLTPDNDTVVLSVLIIEMSVYRGYIKEIRHTDCTENVVCRNIPMVIHVLSRRAVIKFRNLWPNPLYHDCI